MNKKIKIKNFFGFSVRDSLITLAIIAVACTLCFALQKISENDFHVPLIFVLAVMIISRFTNGYFYGLISSFGAVFAVNYMFTYPYFNLNFSLTGYPLTFVTMLIVSLVTCTLTARIKNQERVIMENEKEKIRSDLLRGISHDIRTPLTGIAGGINTLLENDDIPEEKKKELLNEAYENSRWLIRIVENVLTITRIGEDPEKISRTPEIVEEVISEVVWKFNKQYPELEIIVNVPEEILIVKMDPNLMAQVFLNILQNSVDHGKGCDKMEISVKKTEDRAVFVFHDNGSGFRFADDGKMLMMSETGRTDGHRNMGIGLQVSRTIVKAHGGKLEVSNGTDGGAVVTITLPLGE